ncbi:unnamed protein product [Malus baccata var. baccata]
MEQFREGRPLPAVLPSNVMFDLSNIFQPANNYSNENEEQDDPDVRWDPDSDMEVDYERKPLPSRVKKEIIEPEVRDPALDMGSGSVDEPTVKVEQDTMNKPADQI